MAGGARKWQMASYFTLVAGEGEKRVNRPDFVAEEARMGPQEGAPEGGEARGRLTQANSAPASLPRVPPGRCGTSGTTENRQQRQRQEIESPSPL